MTLTTIIDNVAKWAQESICNGLKLKLPDDDRNDEGFPGETVTPTAFPMFVPAKDRLPPNVAAPIPSLCVQFKEGKDQLVDGKRTVKLRISLATWSPGEHGTEYVVPEPDPTKPGGNRYHRRTGEDLASYTRNMEGWRGVMNFADRALEAIESAEFIAGLRLVKEGDGLSYGSFTQEGQIWDFYPYWFLWIDVTLECGVVHKTPDAYQNLL